MFSLLLDENLSRKLLTILSMAFENVTHVANEDLLNVQDSHIWSFAKKHTNIIITKDHDFHDMSRLYGCPPKVVKLNCGNRTTEFIGQLLLAHADTIKEFSASDNCYMEVL